MRTIFDANRFGYNLHQYICWFVESGVYSSEEMMKTLKSKLDVDDTHVQSIVQFMFYSFAKSRFACLEIKSDPLDYVLYPMVEPHMFAHYLKTSYTDRRGIRIKIGQKVKFSVWDGDNAPEHLDFWTGEVLETRHDQGFVEYIIQRDLDHQMVRDRRGFIREVI
ncbi:hypothetical protein [Paenibacillus crassostreae]|uniref:Uncharacterized protein n=1 Tax=Paenibacillus crassostreae TaxID=1763538 RepID=A0A167EJD8_9BACL|nr:hypothetical protein [Paenibacillus crassostreae]AOZ94917.1 hypothetical protein LPB68_21900 [Paenibacillus crassostreae]OAB75599.1 hypothetical protein PNBC_08190 [Paenibacillus crassostreae]